MTDDQIKQNAEEYLKKIPYYGELLSPMTLQTIKEAHTAGAYSRDEEIKQLGKSYHDMFCILANKVEQLRNPWISVKDHLPEMFVDSKGITHDFSVKVLVINENNPNYWHVAEYYPNKNEWCCLEHPTYIIDNVTHWMPVNILKV